MNTINCGLLGYGLDRPQSGISRYAVELARALACYSDDLNLSLLVPFEGPVAGLEDVYPTATRLHGRLLPAYMASGPAQIARVAHKEELDIVHDPQGVAPFLVPRRLGGFARVVTIHDVTPFVHPETHTRITNLLFRHYIPHSLPFVDRVITVSEASRRDILHFYDLPPEKVLAIPCGVSEQFRPQPADAIDAVLERLDLPVPYILAVGALQARKNLETLFEAYAVLRARGWPHRLVIVGKKSWKSTGIFQKVSELGLRNEVTLTGFLPDDDLPALYAGAEAFVFPSLFEGFGLPPLEAMACGTQVVASNSSSLPEVVGDAGLLVDPYDVQGFADAIERLLTHSDLRREYRGRGLRRARSFSWDRAARRHLEVYQELAQEQAARAA
jgi:glycosyltransferase involved in cell wall biosynthesis